MSVFFSMCVQMMVRHTLFCIALFLTLGNLAPAAEVQTDICSLLQSAEKMSGQHVRLQAILMTDLYELGALKDRRCPDLYIPPFYYRGEHPDQSLSNFDKELYNNHSYDYYPAPYDKDGTFFLMDITGVFIWKSDENPQSKFVIDKVLKFQRLHGDWEKAQ